jgi:hypothetical protein
MVGILSARGVWEQTTYYGKMEKEKINGYEEMDRMCIDSIIAFKLWATLICGVEGVNNA